MGGLELWRAVPHGAREVVPGGKCPFCGSARVHRSHTRGPVEKAIKALTPLRPFSCSVCRWRGLRVPQAHHSPAVELPPLPARKSGGRRHRPSPDTTRQALTSQALAAAARRRRRLQLVVVVMLAAVSAGGVVFCHGESGYSATE